jgi:hypothetical protein
MHARHASIDPNVKYNFPGAATYDTINLPNLQHTRSAKFSFGKESRNKSVHLKE